MSEISVGKPYSLREQTEDWKEPEKHEDTGKEEGERKENSSCLCTTGQAFCQAFTVSLSLPKFNPIR